MAIDTPTVMALSVIVELLFSALLAVLWSGRRNERALVYWSGCSLLMALACIGFGLRGQIADWLSIAGANALIYSSLALRMAGLRSFAGQPPHLGRYLAPPLLLGLLYLFRDPLGLDADQRARINGILGLVYGLLMLVQLSDAQRSERLLMRRVVIGLIGLQTMNDVVRLLVGVLGGFPGTSGSTTNTSYGLLLLNVMSAYGVLNVACFMMLFERHEGRLVRAATFDALTSLLNRAGFNQLAGRHLQRSFRDGRPVSVLVMDLDHFKRVNDSYGHEAGDAVLRAFAQAARAALRPTDLLARPGGEEFWALLPDTDLAEAQRVAQRVCDQFREVRVPFDGHDIAATVSIGAAEVALAAETIQAALARADQALYEAKHEGRDRVSLALSTPLIGDPAH